ncbi:MAG: hypothetical protein NTX75_02525 [Proteobacteria bacterium]|nr:hypothetical protein [Pseudomonadota bacterium]
MRFQETYNFMVVHALGSVAGRKLMLHRTIVRTEPEYGYFTAILVLLVKTGKV